MQIDLLQARFEWTPDEKARMQAETRPHIDGRHQFGDQRRIAARRRSAPCRARPAASRRQNPPAPRRLRPATGRDCLSRSGRGQCFGQLDMRRQPIGQRQGRCQSAAPSAIWPSRSSTRPHRLPVESRAQLGRVQGCRQAGQTRRRPRARAGSCAPGRMHLPLEDGLRQAGGGQRMLQQGQQRHRRQVFRQGFGDQARRTGQGPVVGKGVPAESSMHDAPAPQFRRDAARQAAIRCHQRSAIGCRLCRRPRAASGR